MAAALLVCAIVGWVFLKPSGKGSVTLDAEGRLTWTKASNVSAGALMGKDGERTIQYELSDGESVRLTEAMRDKYKWTLEETQKDGVTREIAIRSESEG